MGTPSMAPGNVLERSVVGIGLFGLSGASGSHDLNPPDLHKHVLAYAMKENQRKP